MHLRVLRTTSLLALILSAPLAAQQYEIAPTGAYFRPSRTGLGSLPDNTSHKDTDTRFKVGPGYGVRLTWNTPGYYGFEVTYLQARNSLSSVVRETDKDPVTREGTVRSHFAAFNAISYFMPAGERWRPYMTAGLQMVRYGAPGFAEWTQGPARTYGGNFGGGIKLKITRNAMFRLDVRDYINGKPYDLTFENERTLGGGLYQTIEGSIGISITFR